MKAIINKSEIIKEYELEYKPMIICVNEFNNKSAKEFSQKMTLAHNTGQPVIPIVIDSYGGEVYSLLHIISEINHATLPIMTVVQGKALSCGAILASFGKPGLRFAAPTSTIMIHDVSSAKWGKVEEIKASAAETERLNKKIYTMMARNCGHDDDFFLEEVHNRGRADWYLESKEAKKLKMSSIDVLHIDLRYGGSFKSMPRFHATMTPEFMQLAKGK